MLPPPVHRHGGIVPDDPPPVVEIRHQLRLRGLQLHPGLPKRPERPTSILPDATDTHLHVADEQLGGHPSAAERPALEPLRDPQRQRVVVGDAEERQRRQRQRRRRRGRSREVRPRPQLDGDVVANIHGSPLGRRVHALRHVGHRARHGLPRRDAGHRPDAGGVAQGPVAGLHGRRRGRARRVGALEAIDASLDGVALVRGRPDGVAEGGESGREEAFEGIGRGIRPGAFDGEVGAR